MDANGVGRRYQAMRGSILGLAAAWLALPIAATEASPMRGGRLAAASASASNREAAPSVASASLPGRWASFLAGGESTWASRQSPAFTLPVRMALLSLVSGDPAVAAASPLVEYFVWRRNLNSARFDRYHPFLGPRLPQTLRPPTPPITPPVIPVTPDPPLNPPNPSVIPPTVPEPPALLVILLGTAGALVLRRRTTPDPAR